MKNYVKMFKDIFCKIRDETELILSKFKKLLPVNDSSIEQETLKLFLDIINF